MAVAEDYLRKNPAALLFTPKQAKCGAKAVMTWQEVKLLFSALELRELLVCMLATTAGMRPGEIFGLKWQHIKSEQIRIEQRVYRGHLDSPKTDRRNIALSEGLQSVIS